MKYLSTKFLLIVFMSMIGANVFAHDIAVKNVDGVTIYYNWNEDETELIVSYRGSSYNSYNNEYSGDVVIPESVDYNNKTYYVTFIDDRAFMDCGNLISVTISNNVTSIGSQAFCNCFHLTSVIIPNSVTSIGDHAFWYCSMTSVTIPNSVTSIGGSAFGNCRNLTSVTIPNSVTSISFGTFQGCSSLRSVIISNSVTSIGFCAFEYCNSLTSITIPNSVTSLGDCAFQECSGLTSMTIPNSVTSIGKYVFYRCNGLKSLTIGNSVISIGDGAFYGCSNLKSVNIPNSVTSIGNDAFYLCSSLTSVTIPNSVTSIGMYAFSGCSGLTSITIGAGVTRIDDGAFVGCPELTNIYCYAEQVPTTDATAFDGSNIDYVTLYVPASAVESYKATVPWSGFKEIVKIGKSEYTLTYKVDGEVYKEYSIEEGETITPEADPTKEGYKFSGWSDIPETMPAHDVTITGSFERVYSGGDVANLINLLLFGDVDDEDITLYDMNGDGELNIGDLILIMRAAQSNSRNRSAANRAAENQTIEFDADFVTMKPGETSALNISLSSSISGMYGIQFEVNLPEGFSLEKGSNDKIYEMSTNQVDDITCNDRDLGNGTYRFFIYSSTLQELKAGSLMSLNLKADAAQTLGNYSVSISNVALSDYDGHVTKEDGSSVGVKVTNSFTLLYQVDGEDYKSYEIECGENITPETEPTKEGYTFSGWSEMPETMPAEDVIVTGTFTINQYILTYVVDGAVYKEYCYDYGSAIAPEAEPTKEGYTFSGWSEIPETMPANEVYVVGKFTINKYKITYVIDGVVFKTEEVEYGSIITPPNPGDHEGYDFAWEDYPTTMPAEDILIQGTYTATGIEAILASEPDVKIFTVSGKPLNKLQKGVNILRYKDGRTRKIVVK